MNQTTSTRRGFFERSLGMAGGACLGLAGVPAAASAADNDKEDRPRLRYLGWQVGLSYQTPRPEGKRPEELRRLIREMRDGGMNLLSLMLISYSYFDDHDGFCWPTRRKGLRCYRDEHSLSAVGHVCVRSKPFKNYPIPPKTPDTIRKSFDAVDRTEADNLIGLMFFNESCVSDENRKAVYRGIQRFL